MPSDPRGDFKRHVGAEPAWATHGPLARDLARERAACTTRRLTGAELVTCDVGRHAAQARGAASAHTPQRAFAWIAGWYGQCKTSRRSDGTPQRGGKEMIMRLLGSLFALVAMTASAPALASDYSTDRHFTQRDVATSPAAEVRPAAPEARKDARGCDCACMRRSGEERPAASRAEPGGH